MTRTIPATKLSEELDNLLNEVQVGRADVVIERDGKPAGVLISMTAYENMKQRQQAAKLRFIERAKRVGQRVDAYLQEAGLTEADLERLIDAEVEAVRAEHRNPKQ